MAKIPAEKRIKILKLAKSKKNYSERAIAKIVGCSRDAVHGYIAKKDNFKY